MDLFIPVSLRIFAKIVAQPQDAFCGGIKRARLGVKDFREVKRVVFSNCDLSVLFSLTGSH